MKQHNNMHGQKCNDSKIRLHQQHLQWFHRHLQWFHQHTHSLSIGYAVFFETCDCFRHAGGSPGHAAASPGHAQVSPRHEVVSPDIQACERSLGVQVQRYPQYRRTSKEYVTRCKNRGTRHKLKCIAHFFATLRAQAVCTDRP